MRILAVDHGAARAGLAVSDPSGTIASPLTVVEPPDPGGIASIAEDEGAELVIVGLPVSLSGQESEQAAQARRFAAELERRLAVPVETYDERLTTRMANQSVRAGAAAPADALAAAHLLESYLQSRRGAVEEGTDE
jgi:putative Holliday junction resolvase